MLFVKLFRIYLLLFFIYFAQVDAYTYLYSYAFGSFPMRSIIYRKKTNWLSRFLFEKWSIFCNNDMKFVKYNDRKLGVILFYIRNTCLGQEDDIAAFKKGYEQIDDDVIVFGISRGAATASNFMALHQPTRIKGAVLESPFDHAEKGIEGFINGCGFKRWPKTKNFFNWLFHKVARYNKNGLHPKDVVEKISKDIPIIFVCSKKDGMIPYQSTINLYKQLIKSGHTYVHLLVLESGNHGFLIWGPDGDKYQNVIHAFYRRYNLPHNEQFATEGQALFEKCQPTLQDLDPPRSRPSFYPQLLPEL